MLAFDLVRRIANFIQNKFYTEIKSVKNLGEWKKLYKALQFNKFKAYNKDWKDLNRENLKLFLKHLCKS